jgi:hypothetical protein
LDLRPALGAAVAALALVVPGVAHAQGAAGEEEPPVGEERAIRTAERQAEFAQAQRETPGHEVIANRSDDDGDWEVGVFDDGDQLVQVVVDDQSGEVEETWTGHQVEWTMARGYEGAFGRELNAPYVWLPLCAIFLIGLFDWRRPFRIAHLDLFAIVAGFGVSHYFFNQGEIGLSVPLAYPVLLYLLARCLWMAFRGGEGLRPSLPITWLAIAAVALIGFRIGLNVADSNVIDVGYAGVVGADLISDREQVYDNFPEDVSRGDTYGPVSYYLYVPFEYALPWSGDWDDLPAAHAAAIFFDLGTIAALFLLGLRLRPDDGRRLATLLAFGWAACPYTTFALESNTNDSLVALLLACALLFLSSPAGRGAFLALATLTKFAPAALIPLFATYRRSLPAIAVFAAGFLAATLVVMAETLLDPGLSTFWDRTVGNQAGRDSPFSIWGQEPSLDWLHAGVKAFAAALALLVAVRPRFRTPVTVAALGAAVMIAVELTVEHWFYLYVPWFFGFLLVAWLAREPEDERPGQPAST